MKRVIGIVRRIDELGRVVLPIEDREALGLEEKTPVEILRQGNSLIITKHTIGCVFCGEHKENKIIITTDNKCICQTCMQELVEVSKK